MSRRPAVLASDPPPATPDGLELCFASQTGNVAVVRRAIESLCASHRCDDKFVAEVGLCVNEALANVIRHAYRGAGDRPVRVRAECRPEALQIEIRDWGCGENPAPRLKAGHDPLTPGGLGLVCLRQLMDRVEFVPQRQGMLLVLEKKRKGEAAGR